MQKTPGISATIDKLIEHQIQQSLHLTMWKFQCGKFQTLGKCLIRNAQHHVKVEHSQNI